MTAGSPRPAGRCRRPRKDLALCPFREGVGSPIACLQPVADGMLAGTEHGEVIRLDPSGKRCGMRRWPGRCAASPGMSKAVLKNVLAGFGAGIWIGTGAGENQYSSNSWYRGDASFCGNRSGAGVVAAVGLPRRCQVCFVVGTATAMCISTIKRGAKPGMSRFQFGLPGYLRIVRYGQSDARRILVAASLQAYRAHLLLLIWMADLWPRRLP